MSIPVMTPREQAQELFESLRDSLLGDSPFEAQAAVSANCCGWYLTHDFAVAGFDEHPFGRSAPMPVVQLLTDEIDTFPEHDDVALAFNRVLASLAPYDDDLVQAALANELILVGRGATAPEWSTQLDAWELTEAWQMNEAHPEKLGARVANLLGFRHPSGEEHCMFFTCDPRNFNDLVMIDVGDSTRDAVAGLRDNLAILGDASPLVLEPASGDSLRWAVDRSIRKTYQHDLGPLRHDFASLSLFTLLEARLACL